MAQTYMTSVRIGSDDAVFAPTFYGTCGNLATNPNKTVTIANFDGAEEKVSVQVCFLAGNTITENMTLNVSDTLAYPVYGNAVCEANDVVTFVFNKDINSNIMNWRVVGNAPRASSTAP